MIKEYFHKYKLSIVVLISIVLLVLLRLGWGNHFNSGAMQNAMPALSNSNIMQPSNPKFLANNTMLVYIDDPEFSYASHQNFMEIELDKMMDSDVLKTLKSHNGSLVLVADEPSTTARAWMLLAQKGIKDCYVIFVESTEHFNYEFHPDTSIRADEAALE